MESLRIIFNPTQFVSSLRELHEPLCDAARLRATNFQPFFPRAADAIIRADGCGHVSPMYLGCLVDSIHCLYTQVPHGSQREARDISITIRCLRAYISSSI